MVDDFGTAVSWSHVTDQLRRTSDIPPLVLRGSWTNRPPMASPQRGTFQLAHLPGGQWLLERPVGTPRLVGGSGMQARIDGSDVRAQAGDDGWLQEAAGVVASPLSWFRNPLETEAFELPGPEMVAGRSCSRFLVRYSRHSVHRMMLWLDNEWPLVLAAKSDTESLTGPLRFELGVTAVNRASGQEMSRYTRLATETARKAGVPLARLAAARS